VIRTLAPLIPLFPLLACLITLVLGPKVLRGLSHLPAVIGIGASCVCSWILVYAVAVSPHPETLEIYKWMVVGGDASIDISISLGVDSLSVTMLAMLTFIATLVAIYASGYMHGDPGYFRFFTEVSLFVFSMIMLVLSANLIQLFMFWEAVGLCSYLLIGFWYEKPEAAAAGKKAFLVNRIGDFGFALGIFLLWDTFGSVNFETILDPVRIANADPAQIAIACLCLITGAMGKSAQFPLHVWLPDAMEGPTPVSALIHAATMVTAGVYMLTRCSPLYMVVPDIQLFIAVMGGFTAILAALIALTQNDLKRVLAYSTVSQLGFMFLGLGTGSMLGIAGGMFHLVTHAFFKALLFLGAGSVMHAMGGVIDMTRFSGLRRVMPQTYATFLVGSLALAGMPLLSGFWSKDTILSAAYAAAYEDGHHAPVVHAADGHGAEAHGSGEHAADEHGGDEHAKGEQTAGVHGPGRVSLAAAKPADREPIRFAGLDPKVVYKGLFWMAALTALLTAFYTFRAFFMTFHGETKIPEEAGHHAHESPPSMTIPLWILSIGAIGIGAALGHPTGLFDGFLDRALPGLAEHHATNWFVVGLSGVVFSLGVGVAYLMYGRPSTAPATVAKLFNSLGGLTRASYNKFYIDEVYNALFVTPLWVIAQLSRFLDWMLIDTILVGGISKLPAFLLGKPARPMQNGLVQFYGLAMTLAMGVLLVALVWQQR
jgi:NADH-quinone oxidoreductase subunit L